MTQEQLARWELRREELLRALFETHQINYRTYRPSDHVDLQEQQLEEDLV